MSAPATAGPGAPQPPAGARDWPRRALVLLVRAWQLVVSPWYPPVCRFYPSCSAYAVQALGEHGALRGSRLTARRLLRCHPWNPGGVDHVPHRGPGEQAEDDPSDDPLTAAPSRSASSTP